MTSKERAQKVAEEIARNAPKTACDTLQILVKGLLIKHENNGNEVFQEFYKVLPDAISNSKKKKAREIRGEVIKISLDNLSEKQDLNASRVAERIWEYVGSAKVSYVKTSFTKLSNGEQSYSTFAKYLFELILIQILRDDYPSKIKRGLKPILVPKSDSDSFTMPYVILAGLTGLLIGVGVMFGVGKKNYTSDSGNAQSINQEDVILKMRQAEKDKSEVLCHLLDFMKPSIQDELAKLGLPPLVNINLWQDVGRDSFFQVATTNWVEKSGVGLKVFAKKDSSVIGEAMEEEGDLIFYHHYNVGSAYFLPYESGQKRTIEHLPNVKWTMPGSTDKSKLFTLCYSPPDHEYGLCLNCLYDPKGDTNDLSTIIPSTGEDSLFLQIAPIVVGLAERKSIARIFQTEKIDFASYRE